MTVKYKKGFYKTMSHIWDTLIFTNRDDLDRFLLIHRNYGVLAVENNDLGETIFVSKLDTNGRTIKRPNK